MTIPFHNSPFDLGFSIIQFSVKKIILFTYASLSIISIYVKISDINIGETGIFDFIKKI